LLILFFAATGSLLAYERPNLAHADERFTVVAGSSTLPITELIQECPFQATGMTLFAGPGAPVQFTARRRDVYMVDPYTLYQFR
jgi:hypothetical protein